MLYYNIMKKSFLTCAALLMLLASLPACAPAKEEPGFQSLSTGDTITLAAFGDKPALVAFWRSDCAPCATEKPILLTIAKEHADLPVVIISLQDAVHTRKDFAAVPSNMHVLLAKDDAVKTLHALGDENSAMPYSVFLHADGTQCKSRLGLLGTHIVDEWVKQC